VTTKANAENVYWLANQAAEQLIKAHAALRAALAYAERDFDHNADMLRSLLGAVNLAAGQTAVEAMRWSDWAANRVDAAPDDQLPFRQVWDTYVEDRHRRRERLTGCATARGHRGGKDTKGKK
jgi:hypothetical protein